ncbi:MAG TPA: hypothetical protein GX708_01245 [Gallicola sp.]|nr:hypothetical protein [Gallicola sp.]
MLEIENLEKSYKVSCEEGKNIYDKVTEQNFSKIAIFPKSYNIDNLIEIDEVVEEEQEEIEHN